jgi:hypothetical protein
MSSETTYEQLVARGEQLLIEIGAHRATADSKLSLLLQETLELKELLRREVDAFDAALNEANDEEANDVA